MTEEFSSVHYWLIHTTGNFHSLILSAHYRYKVHSSVTSTVGSAPVSKSEANPFRNFLIWRFYIGHRLRFAFHDPKLTAEFSFRKSLVILNRKLFPLHTFYDYFLLSIWSSSYPERSFVFFKCSTTVTEQACFYVAATLPKNTFWITVLYDCFFVP